jgi:ribonuclease P protein component
VGLPRAYRLSEKRQFDRVLKERSVHLRSGPFRVHAAATDARGARLGLIIGKRQAKRAVERNRIKRALRETFRSHQHALPAFDVVVQLVEPIGSDAELSGATGALWPAVGVACEKAQARVGDD